MNRNRIASFAALILLATLAPSVSQASYLRCNDKTLTADDAGRLFISAKRAAQRLVMHRSTLHVCKYPGGATAWLDADSQPRSDGSELRNAILCSRQLGPWHCHLSTNRYAIADIEVAGARKRVEMELPTIFDIALARQIVTRAFEVGPTLKQGQQCGSKPGQPETDYDSQALRALHDAYGGSEPLYYARIPIVVDGKTSVIVSSNIIALNRTADGTDWVLDCWTTEIVVT